MSRARCSDLPKANCRMDLSAAITGSDVLFEARTKHPILPDGALYGHIYNTVCYSDIIGDDITFGGQSDCKSTLNSNVYQSLEVVRSVFDC